MVQYHTMHSATSRPKLRPAHKVHPALQRDPLPPHPPHHVAQSPGRSLAEAHHHELLLLRKHAPIKSSARSALSVSAIVKSVADSPAESVVAAWRRCGEVLRRLCADPSTPRSGIQRA
ncbi:hypothetical protein EI94DRAFT_1752411, partial [Lactarius quietus]